MSRSSLGIFGGLVLACVGPATAVAAAEPALPPRALLRLGTNDLRTGTHITDLVFSPDGKLIAASEANAPVAARFALRCSDRP